jgi:hypothetical protein
MEGDTLKQMIEAGETARWIFQRNAPNDAINFVTEFKEMLGQVTTVLPGDAGD